VAAPEAAAPAAPELEIPLPAAGRLVRLRARLARSQSTLGRGLLGVLSRERLDDEAWEEIEDALLRADVGVATTGVAGPTEQGAPIGTVFIAVEGPAGADARGLRLPGDRATVRELAVSVALNVVRLYLLEAT
jgi:hypothetical protein